MLEASTIASKTAAVVEKMVAKEVASIIESERRVSLMIERDKAIDREIMAACICVGQMTDRFKSARYTGGSVEIKARQELEKAAAALGALLHKHKKMPK